MLNTTQGAHSTTVLPVVLVCLLCAAGTLNAEEHTGGLPNAEIRSVYENGNEIVYRFEDGKLEYRFVEGRMKGAFNQGLDFVSRQIDDEIFLVSWHDTNNAFYMTLVLDLKNRKEHLSSIFGYANESPQTGFMQAEIVEVTFLE